jgi:hypothetical protein
MRIKKSAKLTAMIEEACIDAYGDEEQLTGLYTMIEENLRLPFDTEVLGMSVKVVSVEMTDSGRIAAICERGGRRQRVLLEDLPLPSPPPPGADWIAAYRLWSENL